MSNLSAYLLISEPVHARIQAFQWCKFPHNRGYKWILIYMQIFLLQGWLVSSLGHCFWWLYFGVLHSASACKSPHAPCITYTTRGASKTWQWLPPFRASLEQGRLHSDNKWCHVITVPQSWLYNVILKLGYMHLCTICMHVYTVIYTVMYTCNILGHSISLAVTWNSILVCLFVCLFICFFILFCMNNTFCVAHHCINNSGRCESIPRECIRNWKSDWALCHFILIKPFGLLLLVSFKSITLGSQWSLPHTR